MAGASVSTGTGAVVWIVVAGAGVSADTGAVLRIAGAGVTTGTGAVVRIVIGAVVVGVVGVMVAGAGVARRKGVGPGVGLPAEDFCLVAEERRGEVR